MDDIVIRLRQFGDSNGLDAEAADEIERLRNCGDMLEMAVRQGIGIDDALDRWCGARNG